MSSPAIKTVSGDRASERPPAAPARAGFGLTDALLLGMVLIWGVNFSVVKYATLHMPPLAFNAARVLVATAVLLALAAATREGWPSRRDILVLLALGLLGNGLYQILIIEGIARTRAGTAALVLGAGPAFIALMGRARGTEWVRARGWAGIALQLAGMGLVVVGGAAMPSGPSNIVGNLLMLAGALTWSAYTVLLQPMTHRIGGLHLSAITMAGGVLPLTIVAAPSLAATRWGALDTPLWGAIAYSGIGALVLAYLFWYRGVRVIGPTRTATYANLQPFVAVLVAWAALAEAPTIFQIGGGALLLAGLLLARR